MSSTRPTPLTPGEPAPWFTAATPSNPEFVFDTVGGRYVLLLFLPLDDELRRRALKALSKNQGLLDDARLSAFIVVRDAQTWAGARDTPALRWFDDTAGEISRRYGALGEDGAERPHWLLLDPALRVVAYAPIESAKAIFDICGRLPPVADHAGVRMHAPVLIVPRIFEPGLCRALIELHEASAADFTGVMRDQGERTVTVMDELKRRRDMMVRDAAKVDGLKARLEQRLFPMVQRGLGFTATRIERYLVSAYDVDEGGVFHAHRDSFTQGTAHRKFAVSINLNADFEGGDLRFPEFGPDTYRPPEGGAVVFSTSLLHEATRVTKGRRYAFLSFLYDEAGAEVLAAYESRVGRKEPA
ncbi:2OG-Fe(II) oxygenase [Phenylobacterium sp.]|jgi:predicted 2-oxoglutarate/Fe(II)-dependent dioxygenase YbiX|uniref:2OG-Fe(II) oxygenase n=1 Tax=Phenylobacterium sp. TaxID=1871053 RepID=UPI002F951BA2